MSDPRIRAATEDDLASIAAVDAACFDAAWTREIFAQELVRDVARLLVITTPVVVGFACTWHVVDEAHLLRIAVEPRAQRRGLGVVLLEEVIAQAAAAGCVQVDLEVARGNLAAVALYHRVGFVEVGARPAYYRHPPDDALLLRRSLTGAR